MQERLYNILGEKEDKNSDYTKQCASYMPRKVALPKCYFKSTLPLHFNKLCGSSKC